MTVLNTRDPSARTFTSRPAFANGQVQRPPVVGRRRLMQACAAVSAARSRTVHDERHAEVRPNADAGHVLVHLLAQAQACIAVLRHDVGQAVVIGDLDPDIGMVIRPSARR